MSIEPTAKDTDRYLAVFPANADFSTNDETQAIAFLTKTKGAIVVDRYSGQLVTVKFKELGRYLCTTCNFYGGTPVYSGTGKHLGHKGATAEFSTNDKSEALRHASDGTHRVVDRIQGVPLNHAIAGQNLVLVAEEE
jgi:hypothetical protein